LFEDPEERRKRNAAILALKRAIEATFTKSEWIELGYATNTIDHIEGHPRLLRSLHFRDEDYGSCIFGVLTYMIDAADVNLELIANVVKIPSCIQENDPVAYAEIFGGPLPLVTTLSAASASLGFPVEAHIRRIRDALPDDPELAVGQTKELLESVFKIVLGETGPEIGADDMPKLLKRTQAKLGLDPKDVDGSAPGSQSFRRLLAALAQIVVSTSELRNLYGTGHGKGDTPQLDRAAAHLIVGAGATLAAYLIERHRALWLN